MEYARWDIVFSTDSHKEIPCGQCLSATPSTKTSVVIHCVQEKSNPLDNVR